MQRNQSGPSEEHETYSEEIHDKWGQTEPGLVAFYSIWSLNGPDLFFQPRSLIVAWVRDPSRSAAAEKAAKKFKRLRVLFFATNDTSE